MKNKSGSNLSLSENLMDVSLMDVKNLNYVRFIIMVIKIIKYENIFRCSETKFLDFT